MIPYFFILTFRRFSSTVDIAEIFEDTSCSQGVFQTKNNANTQEIQDLCFYLSITRTLQFIWIRAFPLLVEEMGNQFKPTIKSQAYLSYFMFFLQRIWILYYPCPNQKQNLHKKFTFSLLAQTNVVRFCEKQLTILVQSPAP